MVVSQSGSTGVWMLQQTSTSSKVTAPQGGTSMDSAINWHRFCY